MTQRKEMFHNASTGGEPRGQWWEWPPKPRRTRVPPTSALSFLGFQGLAPHRPPPPQPPPRSFHQVSSGPLGPRLTPPQSCQLHSVPAGGIPFTPPTHPSSNCLLSEYFPMSPLPRRVLGRLLGQSDPKCCSPLFSRAQMRTSGTEKQTRFALGKV